MEALKKLHYIHNARVYQKKVGTGVACASCDVRPPLSGFVCTVKVEVTWASTMWTKLAYF